VIADGSSWGENCSDWGTEGDDGYSATAWCDCQFKCAVSSQTYWSDCGENKGWCSPGTTCDTGWVNNATKNTGCTSCQKIDATGKYLSCNGKKRFSGSYGNCTDFIGFSASDCCTPTPTPVPTSCSATPYCAASTSNSITVGWDLVNSEQGNSIKITKDYFLLADGLPLSPNSYTDNGISGSFRYGVYCVNDDGSSIGNSVICSTEGVITPTPVPPTPTSPPITPTPTSPPITPTLSPTPTLGPTPTPPAVPAPSLSGWCGCARSKEDFSGTCSISWSAVPGASHYPLRSDYDYSSWTCGSSCVPLNNNDTCEDVYDTSYSFAGRGGHSYQLWAHAVAGGVWSPPSDYLNLSEINYSPAPPAEYSQSLSLGMGSFVSLGLLEEGDYIKVRDGWAEIIEKTYQESSLSCPGGCYGSRMNCETNCDHSCTRFTGREAIERCGWGPVYLCCTDSSQAYQLNIDADEGSGKDNFFAGGLLAKSGSSFLSNAGITMSDGSTVKEISSVNNDDRVLSLDILSQSEFANDVVSNDSIGSSDSHKLRLVAVNSNGIIIDGNSYDVSMAAGSLYGIKRELTCGEPDWSDCSSGGTAKVVIRWQDMSDNEDGFRVYVDNDDNLLETLPPLEGTGMPGEYLVALSCDNDPHNYWVSSFNDECGESRKLQCTYQHEGDFPPPDSWFQTKGGNAYGHSGISSPIPQTCVDSPLCEEYFSLVLNGYSGLVSSPGDPLAGRDFGKGIATQSNDNEWSLDGSAQAVIDDYSYKHFSYLADTACKEGQGENNSFNPEVKCLYDQTSLNQSDFSGHKIVVYNLEGYNTFSLGGSDWNIGDEKVLVFVNFSHPSLATLMVNSQITVGSAGFFALITNGDMEISQGTTDPTSTTPQLQGVYIADGQIKTEGLVHENEKFIGQGIFYAKEGFGLGRDLGENNKTYPAELFLFDPQYLFTAPRVVRKKPYLWREVVP